MKLLTDPLERKVAIKILLLEYAKACGDVMTDWFQRSALRQHDQPPRTRADL